MRGQRDQAQKAVRVLVSQGCEPQASLTSALGSQLTDDGEALIDEEHARADLSRASHPSDEFDQMIVVRDVEFEAYAGGFECPFAGKLHLGYLPSSRIVEAFALIRAIDTLGRQLQDQDQFARKIVACIQSVLMPRGIALVVESETAGFAEEVAESGFGESCTTSIMTGDFREYPGTRLEFLSLIHRTRTDAPRPGLNSA